MKTILRNRVRGFTIMELAIAMSIGVIVVGFGFNSLNMSHQRNSGLMDSVDRLYKSRLAHWVVSHDVFTSQSIEKQGKGFQCIGIDTIRYMVSENRLIRDCRTTDTLIVGISHLTCKWKGIEQNISLQPIDQIVFETSENEEKWCFRKWYDLKTMRSYER